MKVVIAGAGGYLGEHIVQAALAEGHDVAAMVRGGSGVQFPGVVRRLEGDLSDGAYVARALVDAEAVVFAAGRNFQLGLPLDQYAAQNLAITETFFAGLSLANPSARVVFTSSMSAVAGSLAPFVFTEASGRAQICTARLNAYDRAKLVCERLAREATAAGRNVVILNPGFMLGPGASVQSPVTSAFMVQRFCLEQTPAMIARGGHSVCDVRDVARAHVTALTQGSGQYILGGDNLDWVQFHQLMSEQTGIDPPLRVPPALAFGLMVALDGVSAATFGRWRNPVHREFARSLPLYYWGESSRAGRELNYHRGPLAQTVRDTVADFVRRDLVPAELGYVEAMTDENQRALLLLRELAHRHLHRTYLLPRLACVLAACRQNHELAAALDEALAVGHYDPARGRFRWNGHRPGAALAKLGALLDYCYYASDEFRARVS
jgi:dihydroflavonol-4-reductase